MLPKVCGDIAHIRFLLEFMIPITKQVQTLDFDYPNEIRASTFRGIQCRLAELHEAHKAVADLPYETKKDKRIVDEILNQKSFLLRRCCNLNLADTAFAEPACVEQLLVSFIKLYANRDNDNIADDFALALNWAAIPSVNGLHMIISAIVTEMLAIYSHLLILWITQSLDAREMYFTWLQQAFKLPNARSFKYDGVMYCLSITDNDVKPNIVLDMQPEYIEPWQDNSKFVAYQTLLTGSLANFRKSNSFVSIGIQNIFQGITHCGVCSMQRI